MDILGEIKTTPPNQLILWVGAGISYPAPTSLPLGMKLTEFVLDIACGGDIKNATFKIWDHANKVLKIKQVQGNFSVIPRLESILDVINDVETNTIGIDYSFMNGFQAFLESPYNALHFGLARLLSLGATIITCNFDLCIEKAYSELNNDSDNLIPDKFGTLVVYKSEKNAKMGEIWHYHGTVDEIQNMGATLGVVKEGLTFDVKEKLTELIHRSRALIFLGYSFSDAFDINPFFENQSQGIFKNTHAVFFQHTSENALISSVEAPPKLAHLLNCCSSFRFYLGKTSSFISAISDSQIEIQGNFDWEKSFLSHAKLQRNDEIKPFLICRLSNLLGIQVNKLSPTAYRDALSFEKNFPNDAFHDTLAVVLRRQGKYKQEKKHHLKKNKVVNVKGNEPDSLGYYYGIGDYKEAKKYTASLKDIAEGVADLSATLPWTYYTSMSVYCRPLVQEYLEEITRRNVKSKDARIIQEYLPILDALGNRPLKNVIFINQLATALRFRMLFNALLNGKDDEEAQDRILYLYGEGSSIEGYVSAYRDIAIKHYFLSRFNQQKAHFNKALDYGICSLEIAKLLGDIPGTKRARKLVFFLKFANMYNYWRWVRSQS